jgi:hypothetical protein
MGYTIYIGLNQAILEIGEDGDSLAYFLHDALERFVIDYNPKPEDDIYYYWFKPNGDSLLVDHWFNACAKYINFVDYIAHDGANENLIRKIHACESLSSDERLGLISKVVD